MKCRLLICLFLLLSVKLYSQCTLGVSLTSSSANICSGASVTLTASAYAGTSPYTYLWNTGETTSSISVNKAGSYKVTVTDKTSGCAPVVKTISIGTALTPSAPTVNNSPPVCFGASATLQAIAPGGVYQWYDATGAFLFTGSTYVTGPITSNTTFYVQTTLGGCTSAKTPVQVTLSSKPTTRGAQTCAGSTATLLAGNAASFTWYASASGGSSIATGPSFVTPALTTTTTYYVVAVSSSGCVSTPIPVTATVLPPPAAPDIVPVAPVCLGSSVNLHADVPAGVVFWYNVPTGGTPLIASPDYTTPPLTTTTDYYAEAQVGTCVGPRSKITITVNPLPTAPTPQTPAPICYGASATLTASNNPVGTYRWFDAAGVLQFTGNQFVTPPLTSTTTYSVQNVSGSCGSAAATVTVTVNPQLPAPRVAPPTVCYGNVAVLTPAGPGGTYSWYSTATGGTPIFTGNSFTTPALTANATYYVETVIGGCTSPRATVTVPVLPLVAPPTATISSTPACYGSSVVLTASGSTNNYTWYDAQGAYLSSGAVYVTPALTATTIYYVEAYSTLCTSTRTQVTVTVSPQTAAPTVSTPAPVCPGTTVTLTASGTGGGTFDWYSAQTGGTLLQQNSGTYNTPPVSSTTTYYVQQNVAGCSSTRTPVTVTVNNTYSNPFQYSSGTFCTSGPNPTPVLNNPSGGTFSAAPAGLVFVSTTTGQINIAASTPGKYTVSYASNAPCPTVVGALIAIVTTPDATFSYSGPFCQSGTNAFPNFPGNASAGVFTASPSGLVFTSNTTGVIDMSKSTPGTYTVTNTIAASGGCAGDVKTTSVTINASVFVYAGGNQTAATGSTVQLAGVISGGTTSGTWSGGTGTFSNTSSKTSTYTPGAGETSATLTLTSADPAGPCGSQSSQVIIKFSSSPANPTAAGASVCLGSPAYLSATAPGGRYQWFTTASGGTPVATGPAFTTPPVTANITYYVETLFGGVTSGRTAVPVTVTPIPTAPVVTSTPACSANFVVLTASGSTGTYQWYDAPTGGNLLFVGSPYTTIPLTANTTYYVDATVNNCTSTRTAVPVTISPVPNVTSTATGISCSGVALNYNITADLPGTTYLWSRAQVTGISNPAVNNQTSSTITETLVNTTGSPIFVPYTIIPVNGLCSGHSFIYTVVVYPTPVVTSLQQDPAICNGTSDNYSITFNTPGVNFLWSRPAIAGISNAAITNQAAATIKEVLFNTTNAPIDVHYLFTYRTSTCAGNTFDHVVTVNPVAVVTSSSTNPSVCSGVPQNYVITSSIQNATYSWSRGAASGIVEPPVSNQTSPVINETLTNTGTSPVLVTYSITPISNSCPGTTFSYRINVNPQIVTPVAQGNSPVCLGSVIHLRTAPVNNATYLWTGPDGTKYPVQNPDIPNVTKANSGTYTLVVTVLGCDSQPGTVIVTVDDFPTANAGSPISICETASSIPINGQIGGGTTTGVWSVKQGSGSFAQTTDVLSNAYIPSAADKVAGSVILTLSSTSKDDCQIASSDVTITFSKTPAVNAGADKIVCSQDPSVPLAGQILIAGTGKWLTSGTGTFSPSANQASTQQVINYIPSAADVQSGSVTLTLMSVNAGICNVPSDDMVITFTKPPTVNAGGTRYVLHGKAITLTPTVSDENVQYLWTPNLDINDPTVKNPVITGDVDRTYTLTITDSRGCTSQDVTNIKVSPEIIVVNTFTPNGDGINDLWSITGLIAYQQSTVDIYTRYGQKVYHSLGYDRPWDGVYNSKKLPAGVYYYVINTHFFDIVLSGYVTLIR